MRRLAQRALRAIRLLAERADEALATPASRVADQRSLLRGAMAGHSMTADPDEAYYLARYLAWIDEAGLDLGGTVLDAGCGSGRLSVPVAQRAAAHGGRVIGVDFLASEVAAARLHAADAGAGNAEFVESDLVTWLARQPDGAFSAALFLEVAYVVPDLDAALEGLHRVVRPGGVLLAGFRPRWFLALLAASSRDWRLAEALPGRTSGRLPALGWHNWHDAPEADAALTRAGFRDVRLRGIGAFSGVEGDPLAALVRPSRLDAPGREALARLEEHFARTRPDVGRYLLASATA